MKFTLPMPPSINQTYGVSRTAEHPMFKRKVVKDWEFTAGWEIKRQYPGEPKTILGEVAVSITWYYDIDRDIDAGLKVLLDLFQRHRIYKNDRQIRMIKYIDIYQDKENPRVEVIIEELKG